jgi:cytoskeletal protein RodZ
MQLDEIVEENSIRSISKKTNISEENLEALFSGEFDVLKKVKTMGFISIIEREYHADLLSLREQALDYYDKYTEDDGVVLESAPVAEKRRGRSKLFLFIVLVLLGVASWYFITQFDQKQFRGLLPFNEEKMTATIQDAVDHNPNLSIEHAIAQTEENQSE